MKPFYTPEGYRSYIIPIERKVNGLWRFNNDNPQRQNRLPINIALRVQKLGFIPLIREKRVGSKKVRVVHYVLRSDRAEKIVGDRVLSVPYRYPR